MQVLMKMVALTPQGYWQSRRNRFDMFVTLVGVVWIFLHFTLKAVRKAAPWDGNIGRIVVV